MERKIETKSYRIKCKTLTTREELQSLKKGDFVACKFKRNVGGSNGFNFWIFEIYGIQEHDPEIILEKKRNIYFNYEMYLTGESHLASIALIK